MKFNLAVMLGWLTPAVALCASELPQRSPSGIGYELDVAALFQAKPAHVNGSSLTFEDAVAIVQFSQVAISPSGRWVAYVRSQGDLETNDYRVALDVLGAESGRSSKRALRDRAPRALQWASVAGAERLIFADTEGSSGKLVSYDPATQTESVLMTLPTGSGKLEISPDATRIAVAESAPLVDRAEFEKGIGYTFTDPPSLYSLVTRDFAHRGGAVLRCYDVSTGKEIGRLALPVRVHEMAWSPDSSRLLVTHLSRRRSIDINNSNISVWNISTNEQKLLVDWEGWHRRPTWLPDGEGFVFLSAGDERDIQPFFAGYVDLRLFRGNITIGAIEPLTSFPINGAGEIHTSAKAVAFSYSDAFWEDWTALVDLKSGKHVDLIARAAGRQSAVSVADDLRTVAYVSEDIDTPPEVWVTDRRSGARRQLTRENEALRRKRLYPGIDFRWENKFGNPARGILIPARRDSADRTPVPLVMISYSMSRSFTTWAQILPYPAQWLADRGVAVLLANPPDSPNSKFGDFDGSYRKEVQELVSTFENGPQVLVELGFVERKRLGIAGSSMGGFWTGATIVRTDRFRAASIHEAATRGVMSYFMYDRFSNYLADALYGGSPAGESAAEIQKRYEKFNPEFAFPRAPVLMETGFTDAPQMLETFSRWWHRGAPVELIYYSQGETHPITLPRARVASAQKNLDWFSFWLLDQEDRDPGKAEQYARWREMRAKQQTPPSARK